MEVILILIVHFVVTAATLLRQGNGKAVMAGGVAHEASTAGD
jgi:hypothetical protein